MTLPAAPTLGFAGDPETWLTTPEVAARMGYGSMKTFYNDAPKRKRAAFPKPRRRNLYRLGDLQSWDKAGGFDQSNAGADTPSSSPSVPGAAHLQAAGENTLEPRPEIAGRLRLLINQR